MISMALTPDLGITLNHYFKMHRKIKIQCLLTNEKFHEIIETHDHDDYTVTHDEPILFNTHTLTSYTVTHRKETEVLGRFQSLQSNDALYVFSGESADFFNSIVLRVLRNLYPTVLFAFIHSDGIYNILKQFEKKQNVTLNYDRVVRKVIFGKQPRTQVDWERTKEGREYFSFHQAFRKSEDENMWVDSIRVFSDTIQSKEKFHFGISRGGLISFSEGRFDVIFSDVLEDIVTHSRNRRKQFKHRSRSEQPDKRPKPLIVKFGKNIFEKTETRQEFSKILDKYPRCSYSIVHSGNPHVYLSVLDRNDNSSFAVRTYGNNSLLLIPQIKTTSLSLMRFSEFLVTSFYEGVIEDFE